MAQNINKIFITLLPEIVISLLFWAKSRNTNTWIYAGKEKELYSCNFY